MKTNKNLIISFLCFLSLLSVTSCQKKEESKPLSSLEATGKGVYLSNCIACHNPDPRIAGSIGPDIANSSLELVRARVTKAEYPPGYTPKRDSKMMPAFPQLEKDVDALHAYLNSFKK
jgi:mono/diheme cytochrome c family protein